MKPPSDPRHCPQALQCAQERWGGASSGQLHSLLSGFGAHGIDLSYVHISPFPVRFSVVLESSFSSHCEAPKSIAYFWKSQCVNEAEECSILQEIRLLLWLSNYERTSQALGSGFCKSWSAIAMVYNGNCEA